MKRTLLVLCLLLPFLAGCGEIRHVFPPSVTVDQLTTPPNGAWTATLRLLNQSYDADVRFQYLKLELSINGSVAGSIDEAIQRDIPERSSDIVQVTFQPNDAARQALGATAAQRLEYTVKGSVTLSNKGENPHDYDVSHDGWLSPVPGVAHTYR